MVKITVYYEATASKRNLVTPNVSGCCFRTLQ